MDRTGLVLRSKNFTKSVGHIWDYLWWPLLKTDDDSKKSLPLPLNCTTDRIVFYAAHDLAPSKLCSNLTKSGGLGNYKRSKRLMTMLSNYPFFFSSPSHPACHHPSPMKIEGSFVNHDTKCISCRELDKLVNYMMRLQKVQKGRPVPAKVATLKIVCDEPGLRSPMKWSCC